MAQLASRRKRRAENRKFRLRKPVWVDPYPFIPGTEPEKRLFEALMRRHIYFIFQGDLPELTTDSKLRLDKEFRKVEAELRALEARYATLTRSDPKLDRLYRKNARLLADIQAKRLRLLELRRSDKSGIFLYEPGYKPDFVIPEYRVILDPFGIYHHSLPDAIKRDAIKSVVYRAFGYAFYHPWWDDKGFLLEQDGAFRRVGYDANAVLDSIKEFKRGPAAKLTDPLDIAAKSTGYRLGKNLGAGANSVAIANHKRARPKPLTFRPAGRRRNVRRRR